ncbi:MAG: SUMF1/EgtB/PvdO family nonheme iron enzyme, partial [Pirellulaceae bacterium]
QIFSDSELIGLTIKMPEDLVFVPIRIALTQFDATPTDALKTKLIRMFQELDNNRFGNIQNRLSEFKSRFALSLLDTKLFVNQIERCEFEALSSELESAFSWLLDDRQKRLAKLNLTSQFSDQFEVHVGNGDWSNAARVSALLLALEPGKLDRVVQAFCRFSQVRNSLGMSLQLCPPVISKVQQKGTGDNLTISKAFYIGIHEVTQEQYTKVTGKNPSKHIGEKLPVEHLSYVEAQEFCRMLSEIPEEKAAKRTYRLPTADEWTTACQGDSKNLGFDKLRVNDYAWFKGNSSGSTQQVGTLRPNRLGLFDMFGNVWEWCDSGNERGGRVFGLGFKSGEADFSKIVSYYFDRNYRSESFGFRIVMSAE